MPEEVASPILDRLRRPLRDLRISVTDRCNFRCGYCMPAELFGERYEFLPRSEILSFEEIERVVRAMLPLGVRKLRITGGEPLLRADLPLLVERLAAIEGVLDMALTTNATLLPRQAEKLVAAGLRRVTVSLDSLDEAVFAQMNGKKLSVARVLEGIEAAERAGLSPVKLNCVVQKGVNDHTLVELARHFKGRGRPIVRFIEFMDVGTRNAWDMSHVLPAAEIARRIDAELPIEPIEPNYGGEVAQRWRYRDGEGEIGIISSVSEPFCRECTRARLTTDGKLVSCLFASDGADLRAPLREGETTEALSARIRAIWQQREDRYSELRSAGPASGGGGTKSGQGEGASRRRVEMYQIGG